MMTPEKPDERDPKLPEGFLPAAPDENEAESSGDRALASSGHPSVRREARDVSFWPVLLVALISCGIGIGIYWAIYAFFLGDTSRLAERRVSEFPLAAHPSDVPPPEPRLEQIDRIENIQRENVYLRELSREKELSRYGTTADQGFLHIPIGRAMDVLANQLPVRKQPPAETGKDRGLVDAGESSSGRLFRKTTQ